MEYIKEEIKNYIIAGGIIGIMLAVVTIAGILADKL